MTTDEKGAIAEAAVTLAALEAGAGVWKSVRGGERADLVFDLGTRFLRVQCKWVTFRRGVIDVPCHSSRRAAEGFAKRSYTSTEIDAVAAYCHDLRRSFLLPAALAAGRMTIRLRLAPAANRQIRGVHPADAYDFAARLHRYAGP